MFLKSAVSTINAAQANRLFSTLLLRVSRGETVTVLSHGRPIAVIGPASERRLERAEAKARLLSRLREQAAVGERDCIRDELYEHDG